jgi:hypothetical protein
MNSDTAIKVLLTGAAGRIGTAFREHAGSRYRLWWLRALSYPMEQRLAAQPGQQVGDR